MKLNTSLIFCVAWFGSMLASNAVSEPIELPIWPDGLPGGGHVRLEEVWTERPVNDGTDVKLDRSVKDISEPALTIYLPEKPNAMRTSLVIFPGGGFNHLAIDKEGHDVARWLNSHGIAGIVVKYRVVHPESDFYVYNACVPDCLRAIRMVRQHAEEWNLNPDKVGVMGFSAGGYLTAIAGTLSKEGDKTSADPAQRFSNHPNFIAPIYPLIELDERLATNESFRTRMFGPDPSAERIKRFSPLKQVNRSTPPTFLVHAHDDGLSPQNSIRFYQALLEANIPAELHLYSKGGHGYGIRQRGLPISSWRENLLDWMKLEGFLE